jgi:hypothetical protein
MVYILRNKASVSSPVVTLRNPITTALATNSVKLYSYDSSEYGVDSVTSNLNMSPTLSSGTLTLTSITTTSQVTSTLATLTIRVRA